MRKQLLKKLTTILLALLMVITNCLTIFVQTVHAEVQTELDNTQKTIENLEFVDQIKISTKLIASTIYDGQTYNKEILLSKSDFTSTNTFLTATQGEQNIDFEMKIDDISENEDTLETDYILIYGRYPIGTQENPVNYELKLNKDITFTDENGMEIITVPMTFTAEFNYWADGIPCLELKVQEAADESKIEEKPVTGEGTETENQDDETQKEEDNQQNQSLDNEETSSVTSVIWKVEETKATMILTGRDAKAEEFIFEFVDADGNVIAEGKNAEAKAGEPAEIVFSSEDITYEKAGEYIYTIRIVDNELEGLAYDTTLYNVTVVVSEADGKLMTEVTYPEKGVVFNNVYRAKDNGDETSTSPSDNDTKYEASGSISIQAKTKLIGRELKAGEFQFKLEAVTKDAPLPKKVIAVNEKDGTISFEKITYDENDIGKIYEYRITTVKGKLEKITYDDEAYIVKVFVTDKGNGELEVKQPAVRTFYQQYTGDIAPKTGDNTMIPFYGVLSVICVGIFIVGFRKLKKDKQS